MRRFAAQAAANLARPAWLRLADHRKIAVEIMALDRWRDAGRLYALRVGGLLRRRSHDLPGF
ncbi:MAG: hypothetical protein EXQ94_14430 [Alphaproteobacteria bacterium]|nr:hypothetical protein [Alphaproteobacteria bacterium]